MPRWRIWSSRYATSEAIRQTRRRAHPRLQCLHLQLDLPRRHAQDVLPPRHPPTTEGGPPGYHMIQLRTFAMADTPNTFHQGAAAFRNVREMAQRHSDTFIERANTKARGLDAKAPAADVPYQNQASELLDTGTDSSMASRYAMSLTSSFSTNRHRTGLKRQRPSTRASTSARTALAPRRRGKRRREELVEE
jgi:hypothetical protein